MAHNSLTESINNDKVLTLNFSQKCQRFILRVICKLFPSIGVKIAMHHFTNVRMRGAYDPKRFPQPYVGVSLPYREGYLATYSWGSNDKIIYMVHGWESNVGKMQSFIEPLIEKGFQVVAFDMPSHGFSSKQPTHLRDFTSALEQVVSHYGKPFGFIAHSFGGTATVLLLNEKQHFMPEKLCLISPMRSLDNHIAIFNRIAGLSDSMMNKLLAKLKQRYDLSASKTDLTSLIKNISTPGLLIHDEQDSVIPFEISKTVAGLWNGAQFVNTSDLGHRKILRDPKVVQQVTEYVSLP